MPDLGGLPLLALVAAFLVAAALVWWAGSHLSAYADQLSARTGIGQAFAGMILLGSVTALPELATATSAAAIGAGDLALNNMFGSIAFNLLLLAIADAVLGRDALTSVLGQPATLLQGVLAMLLLAAAAAAITAGDRSLLGAGIWSTLLFLLCMFALWISSGYERRTTWIVANPQKRPEAPEDDRPTKAPLSPLVARMVGVAIVILFGGVVLSQTGDSIAGRAGIDTSLVGLVLVALATSLPELSVIITAMQRRHYELAVGDIFGANLFNIAMIYIVDLVYDGAPLLDQAGTFEALAALLALVLTGTFLTGLLERRDQTIFRMGYDSLAVLFIYGTGVAFLAQLATTG